MTKLILALILSLSGVSTVVYLAPPSFWGGPGDGGHGGRSVVAPEMDPASAATALTLLLGGVMVLRARKAR
jgi:hypothetical protein